MTEMTRLERLRPGNLGSLGFLPIEICNNIYTFLLADFEEHETELDVQLTKSAIEQHLRNFTRARHSIDTAILRASRDVHREAYDTMVKKNGLVRVRCRGVPQYLVCAASLPVVTANSDRVRCFRGYVLEVFITFHDERAPELPHRAHNPFQVMILAKDLGKLCAGLMWGNVCIPGFNDQLSLTLDPGLVVTVGCKGRDFEDFESLVQYFTEKTQKEIMQPFCGFLNDVGDVQVRGLVSADVGNFLREGRKWGGPQEIQEYFKAQGEAGLRHAEGKETWLVCNQWIKCIYEMKMLHRGNLWSRLIQEGGECFINSFADTYLWLNLLCVDFYMVASGNEMATVVTGRIMIQAHKALATGHWKEGFTWRPVPKLEARLHILRARFLRLRGDHSDYHKARIRVDRALQLFPDTPEFLRERRLLLAWACCDGTALANYW